MQCFPKCSVHSKHSHVHHALKNVQNHQCTLCVQTCVLGCTNACVQIMSWYALHSKLHFLAWLCLSQRNLYSQNFIRTSAVKLVVCASFKGDAHGGKMCVLIPIPLRGMLSLCKNVHFLIVHWRYFACKKLCFQISTRAKCSLLWDARHPFRFSHPLLSFCTIQSHGL